MYLAIFKWADMKDKKQYRSFAVSQESINVDARTVSIAFSSEEKVRQWFGWEILDHSKNSIRFERLNDGAAVLVDHNTGDQVGVVESAQLRAGERVGEAILRFGKSPRANEIFQDVVDGIRRKVSVGYQIHEATKEEKDGDTVYRVTDWEPYEISIVSVPADNSVGVGRKQHDENNNHNLNLGDKMPDNNENAQNSDTKAIEEQALQKGRDAERKRVSDITSMGKNFADNGGNELAIEYVTSGRSVEEFKNALLEKVGRKAVPSGELGMGEKDIQSFSFLRLMNALTLRATGNARDAEKVASYELSVCREAAEKVNKAARGAIIPVDVLRFENEKMKRDLTVGTPSAGGYLVGTNLIAASFIELLRNRMVLQRLGATTLNDLTGNIAIPRQSSGATAYWVAENSAPTESALAVDQVTMGPKTVAAYTDFSRKLMLQSSIDVEAMVKADLARVLALAIDAAGLYGTGSSNQPTGVKVTSGINTSDFAANTPTYAEIIGLETLVAADNADVGTLAYLVNATGRGALKGVEKSSGSGQFVWEQGNTVNGHRTEVSNQVASNDYWFGNWADLLIGFWSGLDMLVDPYSGSTAGTVRVTSFQDVDVAVRHPVSFARGNNTL